MDNNNNSTILEMVQLNEGKLMHALVGPMVGGSIDASGLMKLKKENPALYKQANDLTTNQKKIRQLYKQVKSLKGDETKINQQKNIVRKSIEQHLKNIYFFINKANNHNGGKFTIKQYISSTFNPMAKSCEKMLKQLNK